MTKNANNLDGIDHVLLGVSDLNSGIDFIKEKTGVLPVGGGKHPHLGTHNALISLGEKRYLEIIAPLPGEKVIPQFEMISTFSTPTLFTWSARTDDIVGLHELVSRAGLEHSGISEGSRITGDGQTLHWRTLSLNTAGVPFFIEWRMGTVHPSITSPKGCVLKSFRVIDPHADQIQNIFQSLGLSSTVEQGPYPALKITVKSPKGILVL